MAPVVPTIKQHDAHKIHMKSFCSLLSFIARLWDRFQVELHGRFSIQNIEQMREYSIRTSRLGVLLPCLVTPLPVLVLTIVVECIPLVSADEGTSRNYAFWTRIVIFTYVFLAALVTQFRCCLPDLPMTDRSFLLATLVTTVNAVCFAFGLSFVIGFPVPFTQLIESIPALPTVVCLLVYLWLPTLRGRKVLQQNLRQHLAVFFGQYAMIWIYPLYLFTFTTMRAKQQSAFICVLPIIKLTLKNYFSRMLRHIEDGKPAFIVFNADLFNSLYVANSLQTSQSSVNTLLVLVVDIIQMAVSMYNVHLVMHEIRSLVQLDHYNGSLLDLCVTLAGSTRVRKELDCPVPTSKPSSPGIHAPDHRRVVPILSPSGPSMRDIVVLAPSERALIVSKIAKVLYIAEFLLLIEFVELIIPVTYGLILGAMYHLSNRAYYPRLDALDAEELTHSILFVLLNAVLEFLSLLVACRLLDRQLRLSSIRLLGYALVSQRSLIQASIMAWIVYVNQQSLVHTGVDFTLRFAWLDTNNT